MTILQRARLLAVGSGEDRLVSGRCRECRDPRPLDGAGIQTRCDFSRMCACPARMAAMSRFAFIATPTLRSTPIIFLTSLVSEQEATTQSVLRGGYEFLPKPASIAKVVECIDRHLGRVSETAHECVVVVMPRAPRARISTARMFRIVQGGDPVVCLKPGFLHLPMRSESGLPAMRDIATKSGFRGGWHPRCLDNGHMGCHWNHGGVSRLGGGHAGPGERPAERNCNDGFDRRQDRFAGS